MYFDLISSIKKSLKIPKQWPRYQNNGQDTKTMAKIPKQWPRYQNNGQDIKGIIMVFLACSPEVLKN
jgi:hypothetical protein